MYLIACGALLASGLILNIADRRMLALTAIVGVNIFVPIPAESAAQFYTSCIFAETMVIIVCLSAKARASCFLIHLSVFMIITHIGGFVLDGSAPLNPYRVIIKFFEVSQLLTCVALSSGVCQILRIKHATTT